MYFRRLLCPAVLLAASVFAQPPTGTAPKPGPPGPPFTSSPSIEDRNLYYSFFTSEAAIFAANDAAKSSNPASAAAINQQTAATLGVTVQDLPTIDSVLQQAVQWYAQVPAIQQTIVSANSVKLNPAQAAGVADYLRLDATAKTVSALVQQLPASSWAGLHSYIIGAFRKTSGAAQ